MFNHISSIFTVILFISQLSQTTEQIQFQQLISDYKLPESEMFPNQNKQNDLKQQTIISFVKTSNNLKNCAAVQFEETLNFLHVWGQEQNLELIKKYQTELSQKHFKTQHLQQGNFNKSIQLSKSYSYEETIKVLRKGKFNLMSMYLETPQEFFQAYQASLREWKRDFTARQIEKLQNLINGYIVEAEYYRESYFKYKQEVWDGANQVLRTNPKKYEEFRNQVFSFFQKHPFLIWMSKAILYEAEQYYVYIQLKEIFEQHNLGDLFYYNRAQYELKKNQAISQFRKEHGDYLTRVLEDQFQQVEQSACLAQKQEFDLEGNSLQIDKLQKDINFMKIELMSQEEKAINELKELMRNDMELYITQKREAYFLYPELYEQALPAIEQIEMETLGYTVDLPERFTTYELQALERNLFSLPEEIYKIEKERFLDYVSQFPGQEWMREELEKLEIKYYGHVVLYSQNNQMLSSRMSYSFQLFQNDPELTQADEVWIKQQLVNDQDKYTAYKRNFQLTNIDGFTNLLTPQIENIEQETIGYVVEIPNYLTQYEKRIIKTWAKKGESYYREQKQQGLQFIYKNPSAETKLQTELANIEKEYFGHTVDLVKPISTYSFSGTQVVNPSLETYNSWVYCIVAILLLTALFCLFQYFKKRYIYGEMYKYSWMMAFINKPRDLEDYLLLKQV